MQRETCFQVNDSGEFSAELWEATGFSWCVLTWKLFSRDGWWLAGGWPVAGHVGKIFSDKDTVFQLFPPSSLLLI